MSQHESSDSDINTGNLTNEEEPDQISEKSNESQSSDTNIQSNETSEQDISENEEISSQSEGNLENQSDSENSSQPEGDLENQDDSENSLSEEKNDEENIQIRQDDKDDMNDLLQQNYINSGTNRLHQNKKRQIDHSSSESNSEIESDSEDDRAGDNHSFIDTSNFMEDDQGHAIRRIVKEIKISKQSTLNPEKVNATINIFDQNENIYRSRSAIPKKPTREIGSEQLNLDFTGNDFERDCDKIKPFQSIIEEKLDYYVNKISARFSSRFSEDSEEGKTKLAEQEKAIREILNRIISGYTVQHIIRFESHLFKDTSITPIDIYTFHDIIKEATSSLKNYNEIITPLISDNPDPSFVHEWNLPDFNEVVPERIAISTNDIITDDSIKQYKLETLQNGSDKYFQNTLIKYLNLSKDAKFIHHRELFQEFVHSFVISPAVFGKIIELNEKTQGLLFPEPISIEPSKSIDDNGNRIFKISLPSDFLNFLYDRDNISDISCYTENDKNHFNFISEQKSLKTEFQSIEHMTNQLIEWAAKELSSSPFFISALRHVFSTKFVVNTVPTERGMTSSDMNPISKYGLVKRLKNKPILSFENTDRWLLIKKAEKEGLLKVSIDIDGGKDNFFTSVLLPSYTDSVDDVFSISTDNSLEIYSLTWSKLRSEILKKGFSDAWDVLVNEVEESLFKISQSYVKDQIEEKVYRMLITPPFLNPTLFSPSFKSKIKIPIHTTKEIYSFYYDPDQKMIAFCIVGQDGTVQYHKMMNRNFLTIKKNVNEANLSSREQAAKKDWNDIIKHLSNNYDNVCCMVVNINAGRQSFLLFDKVIEIVHKAKKGNEEDIPVLFVPNDVAHVYAESSASRAEKSDLSSKVQVHPMELIAGSMARRVQDPLSEITRLVTPTDNYIAHLSLQPFQDEIGIKSVNQAIERACLRAVAAVGYDINRIRDIHHRGPFQFLPGLGPKWAELLSQQLLKGEICANFDAVKFNVFEPFYGPDECYKDLVDTICKNVEGFIRFTWNLHSQESGSHEDQGNIIEGMMLTAQQFKLARQAISFEVSGKVADNVSPTDFYEFFDYSRNIQQKLKDQYGKFIAEFKEGYKETYREDPFENSEMLQDLEYVISELKIGPFDSLRKNPDFRAIKLTSSDKSKFKQIEPALREFRNYRDKLASNEIFEAMNDDDLFQEYINHDQTVKINSICTFEIRKGLNDGKLRVVHISSGLEGEAKQPQSFGRRIEENTTLDGVIKGIDKITFMLQVSFESNDFDGAKKIDNVSRLESSFDVDGENHALYELERKEREKPRTAFFRRFPENDPHCKNISMDDATKFLLERDNNYIGNYLIRPSSQGTDFLELMMVFPSDVIVSYLIVEKKKRSKEDLGLGKELWIIKEKFDDLEDIRFNFVEQIATRIKEVMNYRDKWIGNAEEANTLLTKKKSENPKQAVWAFTIEPMDQSNKIVNNYLIFKWMRKANEIINEPLIVTSTGFKFRGKKYAKIDDVISFWKTEGFQISAEELSKQYEKWAVGLPREKTDAEEEYERNKKDAARKFKNEKYY